MEPYEVGVDVDIAGIKLAKISIKLVKGAKMTKSGFKAYQGAKKMQKASRER